MKKEKIEKKKLCDISKKNYTDENYIELVKNPEFVCKKCGRVSNNKKNLCSPFKIY